MTVLDGSLVTDLITVAKDTLTIFTTEPVVWFVYLGLVSAAAGIVGRYIGKRKR